MPTARNHTVVTDSFLDEEQLHGGPCIRIGTSMQRLYILIVCQYIHIRYGLQRLKGTCVGISGGLHNSGQSNRYPPKGVGHGRRATAGPPARKNTFTTTTTSSNSACRRVIVIALKTRKREKNMLQWIRMDSQPRDPTFFRAIICYFLRFFSR